MFPHHAVVDKGIVLPAWKAEGQSQNSYSEDASRIYAECGSAQLLDGRTQALPASFGKDLTSFRISLSFSPTTV